MQAECALRGHARSLSCEFALGASSGRAGTADARQRLGSTNEHAGLTAKAFPIMMPITLDIRHMSASSPPRLAAESRSDPVDPPKIPLPPSVPSSECGDEGGDMDAGISINQPLRNLEEKPPINTDPASVVYDSPKEMEPHEDPTQETPQPAPGTDSMPDPEIGASHGETKDQVQEEAEVSIPVSELLEALRADNVQAERSQALESQLRSLLDTCGTNGRFLPIQSHLYRQMVHCFRAEEKMPFAALYSQLLSLRSMCGLGRGVPALSQSGKPLDALPMDNFEPLSWIHRLPGHSQPSLLSFLSRLRSDTSFLADCISRLSSSQLINLAKPHRQASILEPLASSNASIFSKLDTKGNHRGLSRSSRGLVSLEQLVQDPLLLLADGLFNTAGLGGPYEARRRLDAWSSVCARIVEDGKPGSNDFCLALIDLFRAPGGPLAIPGLENFLLNLIQKGDSSLSIDLPSALNSSKAADVQNRDTPTGTSASIQEAVEPLLDLLLEDHQPYTSPMSSLDLIRAILEKIESPEKKMKARGFFVSRWFCSQFLASAVVTPEVRVSVFCMWK